MMPGPLPQTWTFLSYFSGSLIVQSFKYIDPLVTAVIRVIIFVRRFVISHCLQCYGEAVSMETEQGQWRAVCSCRFEFLTVLINFVKSSLFYFCTDNGETYYKLSEAKVCVFFAEFLLRPAGRVGILLIFMCGQNTPFGQWTICIID
jgi:hypothetical protein